MSKQGQGESKTSPRRVKAQARSFQAMKLRKDGLTYQAIAEELGYSGPQGAYSAVKRTMDKIGEETQELARDIRAMEYSRLDCALEAIFDKVKDGNLSAIKTMLQIMERRSKLIGLDAPSRSEYSGPDGGPIERVTKTTTVTQLDKRIEELTREINSRDKDSGNSEIEAKAGQSTE